MSEIIAYSSGDVAVEFGSGPFKVEAPLQSLVFERDRGVQGSFVVGSEFLDSQNCNIFDKAYDEGTLFDIRNIRRKSFDDTPSPIVDELVSIKIFKIKTIIPPVGSTVKKVYYFSDSECRTMIEPPLEERSNCVTINNIAELRDRTSDDELRQKVEGWILIEE
jgi:hypothetical protein